MHYYQFDFDDDDDQCKKQKTRGYDQYLQRKTICSVWQACLKRNGEKGQNLRSLSWYFRKRIFTFLFLLPTSTYHKAYFLNGKERPCYKRRDRQSQPAKIPHHRHRQEHDPESEKPASVTGVVEWYWRLNDSLARGQGPSYIPRHANYS
mmetsp:Transcript_11122/g.17781  ORF Transcript_11122/g.17781 Transcript_11122/m.17781 type:complete len:149 (-) Transcript_11122:798-1244(-)